MPTKACAQCPPCHLHGIEIRCSTGIRPKKHQIPLVRHPSNKTQNDDGAILRSFGIALYGYSTQRAWVVHLPEGWSIDNTNDACLGEELDYRNLLTIKYLVNRQHSVVLYVAPIWSLSTISKELSSQDSRNSLFIRGSPFLALSCIHFIFSEITKTQDTGSAKETSSITLFPHLQLLSFYRTKWANVV